jgi:RNA polymerase sigma-70 factor (ECF subfamily)
MVFRRHYQTIRSFVLARVRDRDQADDLAQQVFADAVSALAASQPSPESALAWLYTVARRRLADEARQRGREAALFERIVQEFRTSSALTYGTRMSVILSDAIMELTPLSAQVVIGHLVRGQSFSELARELGITEAASKMRYVRSLEQLREKLEQKGLER